MPHNFPLLQSLHHHPTSSLNFTLISFLLLFGIVSNFNVCLSLSSLLNSSYFTHPRSYHRSPRVPCSFLGTSKRFSSSLPRSFYNRNAPRSLGRFLWSRRAWSRNPSQVRFLLLPISNSLSYPFYLAPLKTLLLLTYLTEIVGKHGIVLMQCSVKFFVLSIYMLS